MEDQIGTVLNWSNQKEPKQAKSKDEVIRRNLDRIRVSAAAPLTSKPIQAQPSEPYSKNLIILAVRPGSDHVSDQVEI